MTVDLEAPIISFVDLFRQKHPLTTLPYTEDGSFIEFVDTMLYIENFEIETVLYERG